MESVGHRLTPRSFILGSIFAMLMCGINSFLTLKFGIMEEGPAIAALFFFAFTVLPWVMPATTSEMVIVATMGSAGGSLGFMSNFFAAQVMTGTTWSIFEMTLFGIVTSIIGLISVILIRLLLIVMDEKLPVEQRLPWPGAKAVKGVIDPLVEKGDTRQAWYLLIFTLAATLYVILNDDGGLNVVSSGMAISIFGLSAYGAGIAFSPFLWGASYIIGVRTCVGFLFGGIALLMIAPYLEPEMQGSPHRFPWPGAMFLVTAGLTSLCVKWRIFRDAFKALFTFESGIDNDSIMGSKGTAWFVVGGLSLSVLVLHYYFKLSWLVIVGMVAVGGLVLNIVAARAAAQTYFNPARVMGIILQGVSALLGGSGASVNLCGAGVVAGSGAQAGNLSNDFAYGRWYKVFSRWQFWTQAATVIPTCLVAALSFKLIHMNFPNMSIDMEELAAPVAKIWAMAGNVFDPNSSQNLPPHAVLSMWIAGIGGVLWAALEEKESIRKYLPGSIGFGLGMILPVAAGVGFFAGAIVTWYILPRCKVRDLTLNTLAVSCIVGEGLGGISQAIIKLLS